MLSTKLEVVDDVYDDRRVVAVYYTSVNCILLTPLIRFIYKSLFTENSVTTQKHSSANINTKYKNTTIKSITVLDTRYWSINKICAFVVQLVPTVVQQLTAFRLTQRVARSVCRSVSRWLVKSRAVVAGRPVAALVRPDGWSLFDRCVTNARRPSDRTGSGDQANYAPKRNDAS